MDKVKPTMDKQPGHWLLAKMGKRILRPGGLALTRNLVEQLSIQADDRVVEFAPGLGLTTEMVLAHQPQSYLGIDRSAEAIAAIKRHLANEFADKDNALQRQLLVGNVAELSQADQCSDKVFGEAILTMQSDKIKQRIVEQAYRILAPNGLYAIHELGLQPDTIAEETKAELQQALAQAIRVNARPLTVVEWQQLLGEAGFDIIHTETAPMHLLEPKRLLADEGWLRSLQIGVNILTHPPARRRIAQMRQVFRQYSPHLCGVMIIAKKTA